MNQVGRQPQIQRVGPERVVRTGPDHARQNLTAPSVVLANRSRRIPCRKHLLANHGGLPERRLPADSADADRPCVHHGPILRIVVDPHLGEIDHQPGTRRIGKNEPRRNSHGGPLAGKPDVGSGIGETQFRNSHPELPGNVEQRVLVPGDVHHSTADHGFVRVHLPGAGTRGGGRDGHGQDERETPPPDQRLRNLSQGAPFQCPSPRMEAFCRCITDGRAIQRNMDIHELPLDHGGVPARRPAAGYGQSSGQPAATVPPAPSGARQASGS